MENQRKNQLIHVHLSNNLIMLMLMDNIGLKMYAQIHQ